MNEFLNKSYSWHWLICLGVINYGVSIFIFESQSPFNSFKKTGLCRVFLLKWVLSPQKFKSRSNFSVEKWIVVASPLHTYYTGLLMTALQGNSEFSSQAKEKPRTHFFSVGKVIKCFVILLSFSLGWKSTEKDINVFTEILHSAWCSKILNLYWNIIFIPLLKLYLVFAYKRLFILF